MRTIRFILQKEFIQIFRDKSMIPIIFVMPVVQLLILSFTATFEIKNTRLIIWDQSRTIDSRSLISKFDRSPFFSLEAYVETYDQGIEWLKKGKADQLLILDPSFATDLQMGEKGKVMLVTDAINGSAASLMNAYAMSILTDYNRELLVAKYPLAKTAEPVELRSSHWYNPELNYKTYMVPGILVLLVTIIGMFLSGMNIVKERELGTIEQINVTPIKKHQFMIGKLLPFWIIALFELAIGLVCRPPGFRHPNPRQCAIAFRGCIGLPAGDSGFWIVNLNAYRHHAAGHVYFLVFHGHLYPVEWVVYAGRKHASLGTTAQPDQSDILFYQDKQDDYAEGISLW